MYKLCSGDRGPTLSLWCEPVGEMGRRPGRRIRLLLLSLFKLGEGGGSLLFRTTPWTRAARTSSTLLVFIIFNTVGPFGDRYDTLLVCFTRSRDTGRIELTGVYKVPWTVLTPFLISTDRMESVDDKGRSNGFCC